MPLFIPDREAFRAIDVPPERPVMRERERKARAAHSLGQQKGEVLRTAVEGFI